jgi:POT family proton-dependent oligopeptide transporter
MFKGHPKGLFVLFFANMGERFGYYTMIPIFSLFLQAKFGLSAESVGTIYGAFLFGIYFIPFFGGILADKIGYGKTIITGIGFMILGYAMMGVPGQSLNFVYVSLFVIALGTGFFKGNLVVILGNMYEEQGLKKMHGAAFNIFYMGINIGAFFAPYAADALRNWLMGSKGFTYLASVPAMAHQFLNGKMEDVSQLEKIAREQMGTGFTNLTDFSNRYIEALSAGYNAAFALAAGSIVISLLIFIGFRKYYKKADYVHDKNAAPTGEAAALTPTQVKERITALLMVFSVVIFFWMAFHQTGLTLTWFARDYTASTVDSFTKTFFDLPAFLAVIFFIVGLVFLLGKNFKGKTKAGGAALVAASIAVFYWRYSGFAETNSIRPELFQSFNPIFVVFLTPLVLAFFAWLSKRGKEPSSPKKIAIGMMIMAVGWIIMVMAAQGQPSPKVLADTGTISSMLVSPYFLISLYFSLTVAELFISPMGLAFVAKVSPPQFRGMMQGGWLAATAIGNLFSGMIAFPYARIPLWQTYALLVLTSVIAGGLMFLMLKKLERITKT